MRWPRSSLQHLCTSKPGTPTARALTAAGQGVSIERREPPVALNLRPAGPRSARFASTAACGGDRDAIVGKTTVAEALARERRLPLITKDEIKESLYETLGAGDVSSSDRIGAAAYALIFTLARRMLSLGISVIVEANFFRAASLVQLDTAGPVKLDALAERMRAML